MDLNRLTTATLNTLPEGDKVTRIMAAALEAVDPYTAVSRILRLYGDVLEVDGETYTLNGFERIYIIGAGKGGLPMTQAVVDALGARIYTGRVMVKDGYAQRKSEIAGVSVVQAGHPLPDERGVQGTQEIIHLMSETSERDLVICLISGGGSALLTSPIPPLKLVDLRAATNALLVCGATIQEINTIRKHLDQVKGGGLAHIASPAQIVTLILSDVVGSPFEVIASGPTVPDPNTFEDGLAVISKYAIESQVPNDVMNILRAGARGELPETPKPGDPLFSKVNNVLIGDNMTAAQAALRQAKEEGFNTMLLTGFLQGEAREAGRILSSILRQVTTSGEPISRPACLVVGGETTVTVRGDGLGGRNQELALGGIEDLDGLENVLLVALATDGGDGPTDAAGAVISGETLDRAIERGLHPVDFLVRNDAYHFFSPLGDLLMTGPTLTNVNDLIFMFAF
jgi:hydroxypyruvate reductase